MQISDENQAHFSIYRTEIGMYTIGDALTDEHLFELCRDNGDAFASLKLMVSHTSAAIHESLLDASYTQKFYTIPPPVFATRSSDVYSPARSQRSYGPPPRRLSSAGERIPQEIGGDYDASVSSENADAAERDPDRTRIKRGPFKTTNIPFPRRGHSPHMSVLSISVSQSLRQGSLQVHYRSLSMNAGSTPLRTGTSLSPLSTTIPLSLGGGLATQPTLKRQPSAAESLS